MVFNKVSGIVSSGAHQQYSVPGVFILCLMTGLAVFWAGLSGPFLFHDATALNPLGAHGGITRLNALLGFIFGGQTGSLDGPMVSLLSLVMNSQNWPAAPWVFKYTNLLIHLLNGVLVFALTRQLMTLIHDREKAIEWFALATMALWLVHPMQVSTIMLVAQRATELSALLILLGLVLYVHGRKLSVRCLWRGYAYMSVGVGLCGVLATMSKGTGALLPLYVLVMEATLIRAASRDKPACWRVWSGIFLFLPLMAVIAYFLFDWSNILNGYKLREFTLAERLLTEPRMLVDYLQHIFVPRLAGADLFDDNSVSTGLLSPATTLFSVCLVLLSLGFAWSKRGRYPALAFAILWFFAGHLLESSFLPLALYSESRNYLPMVGPLFASAYYVMVASRSFFSKPGSAALVSLLAVEIVLSLHSSAIWGDYRVAANSWAKQNPLSIQAQQLAADYWLAQDNYDRARKYLVRAEAIDPVAIEPRLQLIQLECLDGGLYPGRVKDTVRRIRVSDYDNAGLDTIEKLRALADDGACKQLRYKAVHRLLDAYLSNPLYRDSAITLSRLYYEQGRLYADQGLLSPAMSAMNHAYGAKPEVHIALLQAKWLMSAGMYQDALRYVGIAKRAEANLPFSAATYNHHINSLQDRILQRANTFTIAQD